jgi:hypothetical protein
MNGGAMYYYILNNSLIELNDSISINKCISEGGNGGGIYIELDLIT